MDNKLKNKIMTFTEESTGQFRISKAMKTALTKAYEKVQSKYPKIFPSNLVVTDLEDSNYLDFEPLSGDSNNYEKYKNQDLSEPFHIWYAEAGEWYNDSWYYNNVGDADGLLLFSHNEKENKAFPAAIILASSEKEDYGDDDDRYHDITSEDKEAIRQVVNSLLHEMAHAIQASEIGYTQSYWNEGNHHDKFFHTAADKTQGIISGSNVRRA